MFLGSIDNAKQDHFLFNLDRYFDGEIQDIVIKTNKTSDYIHVGNKSATKLKGIQKVMSLVGVDHPSDVLYIAASCVNSECYVSFVNSLITSNSDFPNEIGNKPHKYLSNEVKNLDEEFGLKTNSF